LVYNDMRKQIKDEAKAIGELRSEVKDLANLHGLLLGFAPGSGMVEELKMLKQREREITADILRLKIQFTLLEGIVNVQKIGNLKNDEEKLT